MIEFRPLTEQDYPKLLQWLARPHVKQYWNDGDDTLEKIAKHYALDTNEARYFIAVQDDQDIGFYQYWHGENGDIGVDMFLAEAGQLSKGLGTKCLMAFSEFVIRFENCSSLSVDPNPHNKRGIRCYQKCGFENIANLSNDKIYLMRRMV